MDRWKQLRENLAVPERCGRRQTLNSHELDYGRHAGPPPCDARRAAVLVLLTNLPQGWHVPLMVRPTHASTHAGQVSFPGGRLEAGETPEDGAIREAVEELGIEPDQVDVLGQLAPVYIYASNHDMLPCLAISSGVPSFRPNSQEVARVFWLPIAALFDTTLRGSHEIRRWGASFRTPHLQWESERIWGATRIVLDQLADLWQTLALGDEMASGILSATTNESVRM